MNPADRQDVDRLRKLFKAPRRPPALGQGPETLSKVVHSFTDDYEAGEQKRRDDAPKMFNPKKKER